jgi:hypothetical protein
VTVSRKSRKKARAKYQPPVPAAARAAAGPAVQRPVSQARVGGDQAVVRSVEMSLGATNRMVKGVRGRMIIESADPSIPLDRVPYFTSDLVRLVVVAAGMVVLLVAGSFVVPALIK